MVRQPKTLSAASTLLAALVAVSLVLCSCRPAPVVPRTIAGDELETFCDEFFPAHMEELRIPGLTFVAVQDGETLLTKGYGHASIEEDRAGDPETTVFRIGSISKVLVAVAVMQLVEKRQIDLQADVNGYLTALQVDNPYSKHLTLEHLLTHTGGIEDPPYESHTDASSRVPLGQFLAEELPSITLRPGKKFQYSSYGYALAAYVVEEISGLSFDVCAEQNIFQPLGTDSTDYLLAPPAPEGTATGYATRDGTYVAEPLDYDDDHPGGSIISTAPYMAILIAALLGDGCYGDACVLEATTLADMRLPRVRMGSRDLRQALGLVEGQVEGQKVLGHTGAIRGFGATLDMFPEQGVGYFFALNAECWSSSACVIISQFRQAFAERFLR
ncbi:MAG TPA: serine hydrolase domain-containing protein [Anaerolineae bacterium]|nr:serine hydrolase domain-containing protein [Anaerolineae bacterium]